MPELSQAEIERLGKSTSLDKATRGGFGQIRAEIHHGIDWNNLNKLRKIRKELIALQALAAEGEQEIKAGKAPGYRGADY